MCAELYVLFWTATESQVFLLIIIWCSLAGYFLAHPLFVLCLSAYRGCFDVAQCSLLSRHNSWADLSHGVVSHAHLSAHLWSGIFNPLHILTLSKLYCLLTEVATHACEQFAHSHLPALAKLFIYNTCTSASKQYSLTKGRWYCEAERVTIGRRHRRQILWQSCHTQPAVHK